jgi:hypothetical protein
MGTLENQSCELSRISESESVRLHLTAWAEMSAI